MYVQLWITAIELFYNPLSEQGLIQDFCQGMQNLWSLNQGGIMMEVVIGYFYEAMWKHADVTPQEFLEFKYLAEWSTIVQNPRHSFLSTLNWHTKSS